MKIRIFKKLLSFTLSAACALVCLPASNGFAATKASRPAHCPSASLTAKAAPKSQSTVYYKNDFESGVTPTYSNPNTYIWWVGNGHTLFFDQSFNDNDYDVCTATFKMDTIQGSIPAGSRLQFDMIIPKGSADFSGPIHSEFSSYNKFCRAKTPKKLNISRP